MRPTPDILTRLAAIVGERHAITDPAMQAPYLHEWRDRYHGKTPVVLRPGSTDEVAAIVKLAREEGLAIVPQGGNTGLVGGQIPHETGDEIVLSLGRLDKVRAIDPEGNTLTVEAGVTLARAQEAAAAIDRLFPLSLASQGSCTIGGNISTNAGGTAVIAWGSMRDLVLGLEVVLADGRVWNGLRGLRKDNTGYDLKQLFIGSEGTLGIVTAAVLKLFPRPRGMAAAFVGLPSPAAALALLALMRGTGAVVTTYELMPRLGLDITLRHIAGTRNPLASTHDWYVMAELAAGSEAEGRAALERALAEGFEAGLVEDATIAASEAQRGDFWRLREGLVEAQRPEGGSIKHDVAVPVALVPEFLARAIPAVEALVPGCRPVPFGHLGDGNIHFNVSQPVGADKAAFLDRYDAMNAVVHGIVTDLGGSISAEHGIGRTKRALLAEVKSEVELDLMRAVKQALDPRGLLNPGKVL